MGRAKRHPSLFVRAKQLLVPKQSINYQIVIPANAGIQPSVHA